MFDVIFVEVVNILTGLTDVLLVFIYFNALYTSKTPNIHKVMLGLLYFFALLIYSFIEIPLFNMVLTILTLIIASQFYHGNNLSKLLHISTYWLIVISSETAVYYISSVFINTASYDMGEMVISNVPLVIIAKLMQFSLVNIVIKMSRHHFGRLMGKDFIVLLTMSFLFIIFAVYLVFQDYITVIEPLQIILCLFLLYMNYLLYSFFQRSQKYEKIERDQQILLQVRETEMQKYREIESIRQKLSIVRHDMNNHINTLVCLLDTNNNLAVDYLHEMEDTIDDLSNAAFLGESIIDAILYEKIRVAKAEGINVDVVLNIDPELGMKYMDICSVFSNALDNAIEAQTTVTRDKYIVIKAQQKGNMLFISFKNSIAAPPKVDNVGGFLSSKEKKNLHGFGLKSIRSVAEKYNGAVTTEYNNDEFELKVVLCF